MRDPPAILMRLAAILMQIEWEAAAICKLAERIPRTEPAHYRKKLRAVEQLKREAQDRYESLCRTATRRFAALVGELRSATPAASGRLDDPTGRQNDGMGQNIEAYLTHVLGLIEVGKCHAFHIDRLVLKFNEALDKVYRKTAHWVLLNACRYQARLRRCVLRHASAADEGMLVACGPVAAPSARYYDEAENRARALYFTDPAAREELRRLVPGLCVVMNDVEGLPHPPRLNYEFGLVWEGLDPEQRAAFE